MYHKKAFSLIELLMVIIILGILIAASRTLFTMPSQYIIKGEQCVNSIHWEITRAFYSGISGKFKKVDNNTDAIPEQYSIIFDSSMRDNNITMWLLLEWATTWTTWKVITLGKESAQAGCQSPQHYIVLSGYINGSRSDTIRLNINKNTNSNRSIQLCSNTNCPSWSEAFTGRIDYFLCQRNDTCLLFFQELIDTRSQTINSRKCLSLPPNADECKRRSLDTI